MSSAKSQRKQQRAAQQKKSNLVFGFVVGGTVLVIALAIFAMKPNKSSAGGAPSTTVKPAATGTTAALGVKSDVAQIALGRVPLDTTVEPTWTLTNTSDSVVRFGEAHAEVIEGCCPGPLQFGMASLKPGQETELVFPLQMHAGMDGPHEFDVHVPVERGGEQEIMTLTVTGDFRA